MTIPAGLLDTTNLPGSQSSIAALLQHLLTPPQTPQGPQGAPSGGGAPPGGGMPNGPAPVSVGGIMAPAPQAAPMPTVSAPAKAPGLMDRITGWLSDHAVGDAPQGYEGLLTPDEIKKARPGLLSAIIGGPDALSPQSKYRENLNNIVQMKQIAAQTMEGRRILEARRNMAQLFPLKPDASMDDLRSNLAQQYEYAIAHGDTEMAKDLGQSLRGIMSAPKPDVNKVVAPGGALVGPDGRVLYEGQPLPKQYPPQAFTDKNGNTIWVQPGEKIPEGAKPVSLTKTEISVAGANERAAEAAARAETARSDRAVKDYTAQIKPLRERAAVIDQAVKTIGDALNNPNPAVRKTLYTSAIANFIQAADQKAQIRWQLLNYYKDNVDPSIGGKWEVLKSRLLNGQLPAYSMQGMLTHLSNLRDLVHGEIESQRKGLVKRRPELDGALPLTDEFFPSVNESAPAAKSGGADLYSKYGLTPKKP